MNRQHDGNGFSRRHCSLALGAAGCARMTSRRPQPDPGQPQPKLLSDIHDVSDARQSARCRRGARAWRWAAAGTGPGLRRPRAYQDEPGISRTVGTEENPGTVRLLNGKAAKFGSFSGVILDRIYARLIVAERTEEISRTRLPTDIKAVVITAIMNKNGKLTELILEQHSGKAKIDQMMLNVCKQSIWYENPPVGALSGDGNYQLTIRLKLDNYASSDELIGASPPTSASASASRPTGSSALASARIAAVHSLDDYLPRPGLSVPIVTILDARGRILEDQQRAVVRFALQDGAGADIIFAAGTTGEWDRIDNSRRQAVARIAIEECRRARASAAKKIEAWAGITAHTRADTLDNLTHALHAGADAVVVAPLSINDVDNPAEFVERDIGAVFDRAGRMLPLFLYDNADIAAPGKAPHLHTRDVKAMARLPYVRGIKVTASKTVIGNYTRAASHFKAGHEFAIYAGNAYLIFDLFAPPEGVGDRMRHYWNRYLTQRTRPYGVVAGPANAMPREWQRAWQVCRSGDVELMRLYADAIEEFRITCTFKRGAKAYRPTIATIKASLKELGVIDSDAVGTGTPTSERERAPRIFDAIRRTARAQRRDA